MSILLSIGLLCMILLILFRRSITGALRIENHVIVQQLSTAKWYRNHWLGGLFLFMLNTVLFGGTLLALYITTFFLIPYVHIVIMLLAVLLSVYLWSILGKAWQGDRSDRLKMGMVGGSFYLLLALLCMYGLVTLTPAYPGEDTFMSAISFIFGIVVTTVAFVVCLMFTGFSRIRN